MENTSGSAIHVDLFLYLNHAMREATRLGRKKLHLVLGYMGTGPTGTKARGSMEMDVHSEALLPVQQSPGWFRVRRVIPVEGVQSLSLVYLRTDEGYWADDTTDAYETFTLPGQVQPGEALIGIYESPTGDQKLPVEKTGTGGTHITIHLAAVAVVNQLKQSIQDSKLVHVGHLDRRLRASSSSSSSSDNATQALVLVLAVAAVIAGGVFLSK